MPTVTLLYFGQSTGGAYATISGSLTNTLAAGDVLIGIQKSLTLAAGDPTDSNGTWAKQTASYVARIGSSTTYGGFYTQLAPAAGSHVVAPQSIGGGEDGLFYLVKVSGMTAPTIRAIGQQSRQSSAATTYSVSTTGAAIAGDIVVGVRSHENSVALNPATFSAKPPWLTDFGSYLDGGTNLPTNAGYYVSGGGVETLSWTNVDTHITDTSGSVLVLFDAAAAGPAGGATDTTAATGALSTAIKLAGAATDPTSAVAALTNWASVTLVAPLNTGVGSICDPHAWPSTQPTVGTTIFYDPTISIATNGNLSSTTNPCTAVAQFFDGTSWQMTLVVFTPQIVGNASVTSVASGALTTAIQLTAAAASLVSATGSLGAVIKLAGTATEVTSATGALTTAIQLAGAAISAATASGAFLSGAALAGVALDPTVGTGVLVSGSAALGGGASNSVVAAAALSTAIRLVSAAASVVSAAGALATQIQLTAAALDSSSGAGSLASTAASLAGAATDTSIASASLLTQVRIAGAATELTSATGALSTQIQFLAAATDTTSASGALVTRNPIAGSAASVTAANASLTTLIQMSGLAWSSAAAQGALSTNILLSASAIATAIAAAGLNTIPLVTPPNPMADIRIISALPDRGLPSQPGDTPFGEFYQAVGERLWYGINWTQWLANRWQPDRQVAVGQSIRPTGANGYQNTCIGGGRTGLTEPAWLPYLGANVRDGSALWASGPVDDTSLGATVIATAWAADRAIQLSSGGSVDQISLVLVDTTNTTVGVDYDVLSTATTSDGQANVGTIRILVR